MIETHPKLNGCALGCNNKTELVAPIESTPLNKMAVADAVWARMPVDGLNMTLA